jgi:diguanylate cyclase (GGDEF)-like protein
MSDGGSGGSPVEALISLTRDAMVVVNGDGVCLFANPAAEMLLGKPGEMLVGREIGLPLGAPDGSEVEMSAADGSWRTAELRAVDVHWEGQDARLATLRDVTNRARAAAALAAHVGRQTAIADLGRQALMQLSEGLAQAAAEAVLEHTGAVRVEVLQVAGESLLPRARAGALPPVPAVNGSGISALVDNDAPAASVAAIRSREGLWGLIAAHAEDAAQLTPEHAPFVEAVAAVLGGAIERERVEDAARYQALHDALTGLPNRVLFLDRLEHALALARRTGDPLAVLFLDLDQFKRINDSLGHLAGDTLLCETSRRLRDVVRSTDTVARLSGDEFAVLAPGMDSAGGLELADRIRAGLSTPVVLDEHEHVITHSVGIAIGWPPNASSQGLLRDADAAMFHAKARGRDRAELFDTELRAQAVQRLEGERELRRALAEDELCVCYQPVVSLEMGEVVAAEALVRWKHPERGLIAAEEFIRLAEDTRLIIPLGEYVLRQAARHARHWHAMVPGFRVAVNLSNHELNHPELIDGILDVLVEEDCPSSALGIEITERLLLEGGRRPEHILRALQAGGIRVALDDFGTGYSSLAYLRRLPLDDLKIAREFVSDITTSAQAAAIVRSIQQLGEALGLGVIAEGVETDRQAEVLRDGGCKRAQGYLFSRPIEADAFTELLLPS